MKDKVRIVQLQGGSTDEVVDGYTMMMINVVGLDDDGSEWGDFVIAPQGLYDMDNGFALYIPQLSRLSKPVQIYLRSTHPLNFYATDFYTLDQSMLLPIAPFFAEGVIKVPGSKPAAYLSLDKLNTFDFASLLGIECPEIKPSTIEREIEETLIGLAASLEEPPLVFAEITLDDLEDDDEP